MGNCIKHSCCTFGNTDRATESHELQPLVVNGQQAPEVQPVAEEQLPEEILLPTSNHVVSRIWNAKYDPNGYYDHYKYPKGAALIINNRSYSKHGKDITGTEHDVRHMLHLFMEFGYDFPVPLQEDLTAAEMVGEVQKFVHKVENNTYQSLVIMLGAHGGYSKEEGQDYFVGVDGVSVLEDDFMEPFWSRSIQHIPKIFLINVCREGKGAEHRGTSRILPPFEAFILHSCSPGEGSYFTGELGSWFMYHAYHVINLHAHDSDADIHKLRLDIQNAMAEIHHKDGKTQMPCMYCPNATKNFHFYPVETLFHV